MSRTVTSLQTGVRILADKSDLVLSGTDELYVTNLVYLGMLTPGYEMVIGGAKVQIGRRWPEGTLEDTSISLTSGTSQYAWPSSPQYILDHVYLEYLDVSSSNYPYPLYECTDMDEWSRLTDGFTGRPRCWRLLSVSGVLTLDLRPIPDTSSDKIRITGPKEQTALTSSASTSTIFRNKNIDNALEHFIAAYFKAKWGDTGRALELANMGKGLLPKYDYNPRLRQRGELAPYCT